MTNKHVDEERARRRMAEELIDYEMCGMSIDDVWEELFERKLREMLEKSTPQEMEALYQEYFQQELDDSRTPF